MKIKFDEFEFFGEFVDDKITIQSLMLRREEIDFFKTWSMQTQRNKYPKDYKRNGTFKGLFYGGEVNGCFPYFPSPDSVIILYDQMKEVFNAE